MPKTLTQYRVFIGSPGELEEERKCFRGKLTKFSEIHSEPRGVVFHPVGWEETIGGVGRPQDLINEEDLKQCDYAVFILHDRWGSPTGDLYTSGVEEEWALTEELYKTNKEAPDHNAALFCATKATDASMSDIEWARATNAAGVAQFHLGKLSEAVTAFTTIAERFSTSIEAGRRYQQAQALVNKGFTLGALDGSAEAIAV